MPEVKKPTTLGQRKTGKGSKALAAQLAKADEDSPRKHRLVGQVHPFPCECPRCRNS